MKEYKVVIPEESYTILEFKNEDLPGVATINTALRDFEPKEVFAWHLSLIIDFEDLAENGMPSQKEQEVLYQFEDDLNFRMKGDNPQKPNALFLGRITWNKTRELIWRVYNPEIADNILKRMVTTGDHSRQFDYTMEWDTKWEQTEWCLHTDGK